MFCAALRPLGGVCAGLIVLGLAVGCGDLKRGDVVGQGDQGKSMGDHVVARVGDQLITVEQVRVEWERRSPGRPGLMPPTESERKDLLESMVQEAGLWEQIRKTGFDQTPEIQKRVRALIAGAYREKQGKTTGIAVTDEALEGWYALHSQQFIKPAAIRAATLLVAVPRTASESSKKQLAQKAEKLAEEARKLDGAGFADLVRRHSDDQATRYRGGEAGWMTKDVDARESGLFEALNSVAQPGPVDQVISVPAGYLVARLLEKRDAGVRPLAEVKDAVRHKIMVEKQVKAEKDFQDQIRQGVPIEIQAGVLSGMQFPVRNVQPPSVPGAVSATITP